MLATDPVIDSWAREVGVPVDMSEPDPAWAGAHTATGSTRAEETSEHDAAVAADDDGEPIVVEAGPRRDRQATGCSWPRPLLPRLPGRTLEVLKGRRQHIAVRRVQTLNQAQVPKGPGRTTHVLRHTGHMVGPEADTRWRSRLRRGASGKPTCGSAGRVVRTAPIYYDVASVGVGQITSTIDEPRSTPPRRTDREVNSATFDAAFLF
jgi:hypothetical protein